MGFEAFRTPVEPQYQAPSAPRGMMEHKPFQPPKEREQVLNSIVDMLTGTSTPEPAVARGEADLAAYELTGAQTGPEQMTTGPYGGTGRGFPFLRGGELEIPQEAAQAVQPAAVGVVDAAAGAVPRAARGTAQLARKYGPELVERGMEAFERSPLTPPVRMQMAEMPPAQAGQISTRFPTAVKPTKKYPQLEDPMSHSLLSSVESMKREPELFKHNVDLMTNYDNYKRTGARGPEAKAEQIIEHEVDNLLFLYDQTPADIRERSRLWYDGANRIANEAAQRYGTTPEAASAVYAALSPQKDWFMNVSLGDRVMGIITKHSDQAWTPDMNATHNRIFPAGKSVVNDMLSQAVVGKRLADIDDPVERAMWIRTFDETYNPRQHQIISPEGDYGDIRLTDKGLPAGTGWGSNKEIGNAVSSFDNPTHENISLRMGKANKVRNFYNNIYAPNSPRGEATMDTHAIAAAQLQPWGGNDGPVKHSMGGNVKGQRGPKNSAFTGNRGTYGIHHEAYRRAAERRGVLPREMQSITWEAGRGLFNNKSAPMKRKVSAVWKDYKAGKISQKQAQEQILNIAGGINAPEWYR